MAEDEHTKKMPKVMSWWDYGYQIAMANRTIIVDNNTWNNTHTRVGQAMASTEDKAYEIMQELDVKLCPCHLWWSDRVFHQMTSTSLWMVRIGGSTPEKRKHIKGGIITLLVESSRVDGEGSSTLLNCRCTKCVTYRFGQVFRRRKASGI